MESFEVDVCVLDIYGNFWSTVTLFQCVQEPGNTSDFYTVHYIIKFREFKFVKKSHLQTIQLNSPQIVWAMQCLLVNVLILVDYHPAASVLSCTSLQCTSLKKKIIQIN